jgi:hypothetical protein
MQLSSIEMHCRSCLFSLAVVGSVLGALPCGAETISSHDQRDKPGSTTIRSNPYGAPKKVVKPPPPPPETLIVVPATPPNQQPQNPQR